MTKNSVARQMGKELKDQNFEEDLKPGVCFDPEEALLEGIYEDELSAHRAKRGWTKALETNFLLDSGHDFFLKVKNPSSQHHVLICEFKTACGRYAFWRLTHNQAPDTQYIIETAHIPSSDMYANEIGFARDLEPFVDREFEDFKKAEKPLKDTVQKAIKKMINRLR